MSDTPELTYGEITDDNYVYCPFCKARIEGCDYDIDSDTDYTYDCDECGKQFIVNKQVFCTYTTSGIVGEKECSYCKGTGKRDFSGKSYKCSECRGTGKVPKTTSDQWLEDYQKGL